MTVQTQFDLEAFKHAVADELTTDPKAQLDFFRDDDRVDRDRPAHAAELAGVCCAAATPSPRCCAASPTRGIKTTVVDGLIAGDRGAIAIRCEYPQGGLVRENALIELRDGKIARWEGVQAWDQ